MSEKTSERNPSRLQRFREWFAKEVSGQHERPEEQYQDLTVTGNAIKTVSDGKLERRLVTYNKLLEFLEEKIVANTLQDYVTELEDIMNTLHFAICQIAAPYARAGDNRDFARIMYGWDCLHASAISKCTRVKMFFASEQEKVTGTFSSINEIVVNNLRLTLLHHFIPRAFDVLNYCFRDLDVRERSVTSIQTMTPFQLRGEGLQGAPASTEY